MMGRGICWLNTTNPNWRKCMPPSDANPGENLVTEMTRASCRVIFNDGASCPELSGLYRLSNSRFSGFEVAIRVNRYIEGVNIGEGTVARKHLSNHQPQSTFCHCTAGFVAVFERIKIFHALLNANLNAITDCIDMFGVRDNHKFVLSQVTDKVRLIADFAHRVVDHQRHRPQHVIAGDEPVAISKGIQAMDANGQQRPIALAIDHLVTFFLDTLDFW